MNGVEGIRDMIERIFSAVQLLASFRTFKNSRSSLPTVISRSCHSASRCIPAVCPGEEMAPHCPFVLEADGGCDVSMDLGIAQGLNFLALILCPVFKQLLYSDEFERPGGAHPLREP